MKKILLSFVAILCATTFAFAEIVTRTGQCGNNATWTVSWDSEDTWNQTLTISGSGAIWDYPHNGDDSPVSGVSYTHIRKVIIGNSITRVGDAFFTRSLSLCDGVDIFTWSSGLKSIGKRAFAGVDIDPITLPNNLETIEDEAFYGCHYTHYVTIPASVTYIAPSAFRNIHLLETITVDESNKVYASKDGVLYNKAMTELILIPFYNKPNSDYRLDIPKGVTTIDDNAFPEYSSARLSHIVLPMTIEHIGGYGLSNSALEKLTCMRPVPPEAQATSFNATPADIPVYIPSGSLAAYQAATGWSKFTNFIETEFPNDCAKPTSFKLVGEASFSSATVSFTPGASGQTGWGLRYKKSSASTYQTYSQRLANSGQTTCTMVLGGLEPETSYDVVAFAVCGASLDDDVDISYNTTPITFTTQAIPPVQTTPTVDNDWVYYGTNTFGMDIEITENPYWGIMIPTNTAVSKYLDKVKVYASNLDKLELAVYTGGNTPDKATKVWSQNVQPTDLNQFNELALLEPVEYVKNKPLWIFLRHSQAFNNPMAASADANAPNARWIGIPAGDKVNWMDVKDYDAQYTYFAWLIDAHFTATAVYQPYAINLQVERVTDNAAVINWVGRGKFELRYGKEGTATEDKKVVPNVTAKKYTFSGLEKGSYYEFEVRAMLNDVWSDWSEVLKVLIEKPEAINSVESGKAQSQKVIREGQLYILHDGKVYNAAGMRVE